MKLEPDKHRAPGPTARSSAGTVEPGADYYQRLVQQAAEPMVSLNVDGRIQAWNTAATQLTGWSAHEIVGQPLGRLLPPDQHSSWAAVADRVLQRQQPEQIQTLWVHKDGSRLAVSVQLWPVRNGQGAVDGLGLIARQLCADQQLNAALLQDRDMMATLMDTIPDHIYFKDRQSRFLRISRSLARAFKLADPAEAVGKTDFDFFTAEHAQQAFADEQRILETGQPLVNREEKETWPDGSVTWVSTTKQCWRDQTGAIIGTFGISRDVTARKLAEHQLRQSQQRLQSILDHTSAVIYMKDAQGRYLLVNRQFQQLFRLTQEQIVGKTDFDVFAPAVAAALRANDLAALASDTPLQFEEQLPQDDGLHTYLSVKFRLQDTPGGAYAVCGISTDITERKRAEDALRQTAAELARSNADLEQFAYAASHDLQEPLRMIASYLQLLQRRYAGRLDATADEFIGFAVEGAKRMQGLINDLLAYSRVGRATAPLVPIDCNQPLQAALANLRMAIAEANATVVVQPLPWVLGDTTQLTQLFQNLISNCLKFRAQRPLRIDIWARPAPSPGALAQDTQAQIQDQAATVQATATQRPPTGAAQPPSDAHLTAPALEPATRPARHPAGPAPAQWIISVRDNGIGIDPEHFDQIFLIFRRLHTRDQYPGSGVGLSICKRIVERHGGRIWVESQPGQGAVFHFTLRAAEPVRAAEGSVSL